MAGRMIFWLMVYSFAIFIKVSKEQWEKYPGCLEKSLVGKERNLNIPDSSYTASSHFDHRYQPHKAKLYGKYGWSPRYKNSADYLQINLGTPRVITAVATQGNGGDPDDSGYDNILEWVISYNLSFSNNTNSWVNHGHEVKGNDNQTNVTRHDFKTPITAQYIKFIPLKYKNTKTMRVNVYVSIKIQEAFRVIAVPGRKSIRLTWAIIPCSLFNVTGYTVTLNGNKNFPVNSNKNVYQLSKLKAYTEYNVSVKAKTQQGDDLWSNVKSVRTSIEEPTEAPVIISIEAVSSNCLSIALKKPARDTINGPFKGYKISYKPQGGISKNIDVVGDVAKYNLTSLLKYTMYSIRIAVRNTKCIGPSIERSVRTMEDAPSAPLNLNSLFKPASGLVRPRVVITWRKPFIPNGIIRTYTIIYYFNNMHTTNNNIVTIKEGATSSLTYTINVVSSGTFSYNISASTIKEGPYAVGKSIKIPEYRCPEQSLVGKERNLNTTNISYTASSHFDHRYQPHNSKLYGKYGWAPKDNNNPDDYLQIDLGTPRVITAVATQGNGGDPDRVPHIQYNEWVTRYKLQYSNNASNWNSYEDDTHKMLFKGNNDSSSVVRHDLENPITAKYIRFVPTAHHIKKTMRVNVYISFQEAPRIRLLAIGKRSIQLSWTVKQCSPAYPITGYEVKLTGKMRTHEKNTIKLECTVGNLKPYTEYNVTVRAIKQVGYGVWSNITTTRTDIAEPEEAPVIIKVETKTFQSVTMEWELKHTDLINGPFKGYMIKYTPQGGNTKTTEVVRKVFMKYTTHTLKSLRKYTPYSFSVAVMNERFTGPFSTEQHTRTMEDKPDKSPAITSMEPISSESIPIKWKKVDRDEINGPFKAYRIFYTPQGGSPDIIDVGDSATFNLTSLLKYTIYSVTIAVMNEKFVGPQSTELSTRTLEDAPSAPINVNGTLIPAQGSFEPRVVITWDRPSEPNGIIRKYTIVYYYNQATSNSKTVIINGTSDLQYTMNVTTSGVLSFKIRATTIKEGPYQMGNNIEVPSDRKGTSQKNTQGGSAASGLAAGLVVGIILIILFLVLLFLIWKRKHTHHGKYEAAEPLPLEVAMVDDTSPSATSNSNFLQETAPEIAPSVFSAEMERHRSSRRPSYRSASFKSIKRPIEFPAPDINKLKKEFKSIPVEPRFDCKEGTKSANKVKNRYKNIIAYDHSLVTLEWVYGDSESFYINANYIHGYDGTPEVYIATQGPLDTTLNDFWRMIWEQSVSSIVMLTNLRELGKKKCYQYWPDDCDQYSDITITNHKTEVFADFTIRTFFLSKAGSQNRRVRQFHFTAWPDKGVPDHATAVLSFRRKVLALSSSDNSRPTVVHCSAGVGRTGTYIMIDAMLRQAEEQQHVDILDYLRTIRNDRPYMVQTVEQYIFVNMAIYDALTCGNTEVPVQNLLYAIQQLSVVDRRHKLTGYALEFQRLEDVTSEDIQSGNFDVGLSRKNVKKNRYPNIVAANGNRVILSTENDTEIGDYINSSVIEAYKERKGDYINASFVDTYREHNAFIMTQAPMENTIADFWRMVMDYKIGTIVMLNNSEEEREVFPQYWPLHEAKTYDSIKVRLVETKHLAGNIILRILKVSNRKKQLTVNHFQHLTWENECVPTNPQSVLTLLHEVQKSQQKSGNSPIVVQCSNGVGRSGTFCAIASCLERVKQEQVLDVFQTIKSIRVNRPGAVETLAQYVFCYNIIQKYLDSFRDYANFGDI